MRICDAGQVLLAADMYEELLTTGLFRNDGMDGGYRSCGL